MKMAEIKKRSTPELEKSITDLKAKLFNLRFQLAVGQLENTAEIGNIKKTIAQMKTVITLRDKENSVNGKK